MTSNRLAAAEVTSGGEGILDRIKKLMGFGHRMHRAEDPSESASVPTSTCSANRLGSTRVLT